MSSLDLKSGISLFQGFYSPLLLDISVPFSNEEVATERFKKRSCNRIHMNPGAIGSIYLLHPCTKSPKPWVLGRFLTAYLTSSIVVAGDLHFINDNKHKFVNVVTRCMLRGNGGPLRAPIFSGLQLLIYYDCVCEGGGEALCAIFFSICRCYLKGKPCVSGGGSVCSHSSGAWQYELFHGIHI
jgi:hypothetical protein